MAPLAAWVPQYSQPGPAAAREVGQSAASRPDGDDLPRTLLTGPRDAAGPRAESALGTAVAYAFVVENQNPTKATTVRAVRAKTQTRNTAAWARVANLGLGIWLQVSAFAWPHTDGSRMSAWLPGLLASVIALLSMNAPPMRWLNGVTAIWLLGWTASSAGSETLTYWNGVICGVLLMVFSSISSKSLASDWVDD